MGTANIKNIKVAAKAGGEVLRQYFGQALKTTIKTGPADFVTQADLESEAEIIRILEAAFPDYNIDSEERGLIDKGSDWTFVIDPLDGSNNFVCGIPNFAVSIALLKQNTLEVGVIQVPLSGQIYWAARNQGAYVGDLPNQPLRVSAAREINCSTIAVGMGYDAVPMRQTIYNRLAAIRFQRVLSGWCSTLEHAVLAAGKIELALQYKGEQYDFLAGKIIMREAGAIITDLAGQPESSDLNGSFIAGNSREMVEKFLAGMDWQEL
ncbi:inositol monophosphatase [Candidatus Falkowbacteria bacterium]|nr:inositol monophosphatase [Candidatus Falkowbacteria bacterium]